MAKRKDKVEVISEIERKIVYHKDRIAKLEMKKEEIQNPTTNEQRAYVNNVISQAKANGLTVEQIAEKLGINTEK